MFKNAIVHGEQVSEGAPGFLTFTERIIVQRHRCRVSLLSCPTKSYLPSVIICPSFLPSLHSSFNSSILPFSLHFPPLHVKTSIYTQLYRPMYPPSLWDSSHSSHRALHTNNTNPSFNFITGKEEGGDGE